MLGKGKKSIFGETEDIITKNNLRDYFDVNVKIIPFDNKGKIMKTIVPLAG
ncbi:MAG: hypothetical protein PHE70_03225 [Tepidanaerobacteraceae bacterium]|nr:hypothetical protein [Tepidanaerobacteraceae bacterium]